MATCVILNKLFIFLLLTPALPSPRLPNPLTQVPSGGWFPLAVETCVIPLPYPNTCLPTPPPRFLPPSPQVPSGGWFPLAVATCVCFIMTVWWLGHAASSCYQVFPSHLAPRPSPRTRSLQWLLPTCSCNKCVLHASLFILLQAPALPSPPPPFLPPSPQVPSGGWFPLAVATCVCFIMTVWWLGQSFRRKVSVRSSKGQDAGNYFTTYNE